MFSRVEIRRLLIPLIIEQFLSYLVGLADSIMVSSAGEAAVSAVSLVDSVSVLMVNIFAALAAGGAIVVGQYLGLRSQEQARRAGQQLIMALLILSLLMTALLLFLKAACFGFCLARVSLWCKKTAASITTSSCCPSPLLPYITALQRSTVLSATAKHR